MFGPVKEEGLILRESQSEKYQTEGEGALLPLHGRLLTTKFSGPYVVKKVADYDY